MASRWETDLGCARHRLLLQPRRCRLVLRSYPCQRHADGSRGARLGGPSHCRHSLCPPLRLGGAGGRPSHEGGASHRCLADPSRRCLLRSRWCPRRCGRGCERSADPCGVGDRRDRIRPDSRRRRPPPAGTEKGRTAMTATEPATRLYRTILLLAASVALLVAFHPPSGVGTGVPDSRGLDRRDPPGLRRRRSHLRRAGAGVSRPHRAVRPPGTRDPRGPDGQPGCARARAGELDRLHAVGGPVGSLHCIPVLVKDQVRGCRNADHLRVGASSRTSIRDADATIVVRMREAGAVILGKATMGEFAQGYAGSAFGLCRNVYALDRNPSGSSCGSGIAAAGKLLRRHDRRGYRRLDTGPRRAHEHRGPQAHAAAREPVRDVYGKPDTR